MDKKSSDNILFGEWARQRRHILDLTQQELADQVGCARITLRRIEAGALKPSKELAKILLEKLGTPSSNGEAWLQFARGLSGFPEKADSFSSKQITNLPTSLTSFIGREREEQEVIDLIAKNRLVTLVGVGGIGKTRLALRVGQRLLNNYSQGVWFIALDSLSDPTLVSQTVASIFDIREGSTDQPLLERLTYVLSKKSALLIFDNCEHLLAACAQLIKILLENCPNVKILATSREVLNLEGEATYSLPTLSTPDDFTALGAMTDYESIHLFVERASLALPSFRLTKENAQPILNICHRVEGIPLAIELAAAHINILQAKEILKQLNESFSLLARESLTALPRHQTIHASLDWSWGLLSELEQRFMRQLSVFAGGWTLESAQSVCEGNTFRLISSLVKKSLIMVDQRLESDTRYHFHEIVRQYARERLLESDEEENTRTRHLKYFLQLSEKAELGLRGPTQIEWYARLSDERDNIRAALEQADKTDVEAGLYISGKLHRFWESLDLREGARWLAGFLQKSESKRYQLARAKALCIQARIMSIQDYNFACVEAQESLDIYRANGDKSGEIDALLTLGQTLTDSSAPIEKVMNLFESALALSESLGDQWRQAYTLSHMGWRNNYQRSVSVFEKAVKLFKKVGDLESATENMLNLVMRHMINSNLQLAQKRLDEVVKISQNLNSKELKAEILHNSGCIALIRGDYEKANSNLLEAMAIAQELGHRTTFLWTYVRLGYVALREGNLVKAGSIFIETTNDFQKDQNAYGIVFTLEGMASLYITLGKANIAARLIGWANAAREKIEDTRPRLEQADVDKIISACVGKMGQTAFSEAYDQGQKMTLDEAVDLALNTL